MHYHIVTLFPESMKGYVAESILRRAQKNKLITISFYNPMDFTKMSRKGALKQRVDDKPYGGGPGMVIRPEPVIKAIQKAVGRKKHVEIVHFAPRGEKFTTEMAQEFAQTYQEKKLKHLVLICGRYEGIDTRVEEVFPGVKVSVGDYVLTGGELPALIMIDSITRQLPGVLGDADSREETRIASTKYYTRPEVFTHKGKRYQVPGVLLSGNHKDIDKWREEN